ncbi:MAG: hypothetical protein AAFQ17_03605 [Pseudomonadota bacterium]
MSVPSAALAARSRLIAARAAARHARDVLAFSALWASLVALMGAGFLMVFGPLRMTADRIGYAFANEDLLTDLIYGGLLREVGLEVAHVVRTIGPPSPWEAVGIMLSAVGLWFARRDDRDGAMAAAACR